jgi:diguanylate cyclase
MTDSTQARNRRILLVDDNPAIHTDYRKVFDTDNTVDALDADEDLLFGGGTPRSTGSLLYEMVSAHQGQEALDLVVSSLEWNNPFSVALVDMRMPPGWDGLETVARLWQADPCLLIIFCTAYSDYSWSDMVDKLGITDRFVLLKKPFDAIEVKQLVASMVERWHAAKQADANLDDLARLQRITEHLLAENERLRELLTRTASVAQGIPRLPGTVLLADPSPEDRGDAVQLLVPTGADVVEFEDGYEVVNEHLRRRATGEQIAAVVLELALPDLLGTETIRALRSDGFNGPILVRAHLRGKGDIERALAAGATAVVAKSDASLGFYSALHGLALPVSAVECDQP